VRAQDSSLYLHAYSMLDMNVVGLLDRGVSTTYKITVGYLDAIVSVMIVPEADHVNTSICPGVSTKTNLHTTADTTGFNHYQPMTVTSTSQWKRVTHSKSGARRSTMSNT
jgi:hypothetical protein